MIGDCRSAALVSRGGSIDWLCLPRFDSPSIFGALLDPARGGRCVFRPRERFETTRRYVPDTNVLETTFTTDRGRLRLTDLFPVASEEDKRHQLGPGHELLRAVECVEGTVEVEFVCEPRPRYGLVTLRPAARGRLGFCYQHGADALHVTSDLALTSPGTGWLRAVERMARGDRRYVSLAYAHGEPAVMPALGGAAARRITQTIDWWRAWTARCRYDGPAREAVVRSALALKLMTYAPSGAMVAAPTTSLPEAIGGELNWDYRYCWLRDASLTLRALMGLGYGDEARAFLSWTLHSTALSRPELRVLYDVYGETRLQERVLTHLAGYRDSRPVRTGNAAGDQLQLDTYGEVVDGVFEYVRRGGQLDRTTARLLRDLGETVCRRWREPDEGIWEIRGGRRHHTYSKAMCWVTLDRLIRLHRAGHIAGAVDRFVVERDAIRAAVEAKGYNERLQSYVSVFGGQDVDASLLLLGRFGYVEPAAPRMRATADRIREQLTVHDLVYRYLGPDGHPAEGAFGIASFWAVDCRARQGDIDGASEAFTRLCAMANDVGLFGEEIDPVTGEHLGNFPQAFTHVGLIDAALTLAEATGRAAAGAAMTTTPGIGSAR
jgi:GH15 family glucan-1,4-alpha-glucosidase